MFGFADTTAILVCRGYGYGRRPQCISSTHTANLPVSYRCNTASVPVSCRLGYGHCQHCVKGTNTVNVPVCYGRMKSEDTVDV